MNNSQNYRYNDVMSKSNQNHKSENSNHFITVQYINQGPMA